jgi:cell division protein FtsQ
MAGITRPRRSAPVNRTKIPLERRKTRSSSSVLDKLVPTSGMASRKSNKDSHKKSKRQTYAPPPVMARGVIQDMAVPARKRTQPRQRYDVALNVPGVEVRLPSLPAIRFGWRVASSLLVILMALSLYILLYTPAFQVDVLEVEGLQRLSMDDINSALDVSGESIVKIDPGSLQSELRVAFPELSSVKVKVGLPANIKISVVERTPIISWVERGSTGNLEEKWIDQDGFAFQPHGEAGNLIKVEADGTLGMDGLSTNTSLNALDASQKNPAVSPLLSPELIATLQAMGKFVPKGTPILFSAEHGFGWKDPGGWQVYFGKSLAEMSQKLLVYQKLVESLAKHGIEPSMVSVEFLDAPFYRTER